MGTGVVDVDEGTGASGGIVVGTGIVDVVEVVIVVEVVMVVDVSVIVDVVAVVEVSSTLTVVGVVEVDGVGFNGMTLPSSSAGEGVDTSGGGVVVTGVVGVVEV